MSNAAQTNASARQNRDARIRRVLIIAHSHVGESLPAQLSRAGYEVRGTHTGQAAQAIAEFAPQVALIEVHGEEQFEFAHRLRAKRATSTLPLVLLFEQEHAGLRALALRIGADDYFALATPPAEIIARLEALFWRSEAGRRTASLAALERRAEIDGFLQLLDVIRADIDEGLTGTLALIAAGAQEETPTSVTRDNAILAEVHDFFKLNLRRVDSVAFYGPTLLLVYLPRKMRDAAQTDLARLSVEFQELQPASSLDIGLASFPSDNTEIESLIEQAEAALQSTRSPQAEQEAEKTSSATRPHSNSVGDASSSSLASSNSQASTTETTPDRYARSVDQSPSRAVRESKQTDNETSMIPASNIGGTTIGEGTLAQAAADAAANERKRRTRGAIMPRRLLLTISDPARMAQINLLLRSAGYEVRAAFDGWQAINLLRIERPDLLVIDHVLNGIDGLESLRRLQRQHHGRLPLPVVILLSNAAAEQERVREEAHALGAHCFVTVPYNPEELLTCVRTVGSTN